MDTSTIVNIVLSVLSFILATVSVVTVVITLRQNSKMIEESTRPIVAVYTEEINSGIPLFYLVIKNFGKSTAYMTRFESDFDFAGCYKIANDRNYLKDLKNAFSIIPFTNDRQNPYYLIFVKETDDISEFEPIVESLKNICNWPMNIQEE